MYLDTLNGARLLFSDIKSLDERFISIGVNRLNIIQQATATADQLEKTTAGMVIFFVLLKMRSKLVNPLSQESDLNIGRTGITIVSAVTGYEFRFLSFV